MGNIVNVHVLNEKIIFNAPNKGIVADEVNNVASFNSKTKELLNSGFDQETYQKLSPKKWEKYKNQIMFVPAFDSNEFNPQAATMLLWTWWNEKIRRSAAGQFLFRYQSTDELNILFENYEAIPNESQGEFEFLVFSYFHLRKLSINHKEKYWKRTDNLPGNILVGMSLAFSLMLYVVMAKHLFFLIDTVVNLGVPDLYASLIFFLIAIVCLFIFIFVGNLLGTFLWMLMLKPFYSKEILLLTCAYRNSQPRQYYIFKTDKYLTRWIFGN